uniref:Xylulose kinase-1 n=1 Tax=Tanacetum cinerariifolium TaxID=118510 RepID=A0A6L2LQD1_TANCI|nr:hypothetical protein [Tanacetum cinerariifolium]
MSTLKFTDVHNLIAFLSKPTESKGFKQIIDFLNANPNKYALTMNPTVYTSCIQQFWATATAKNINGEAQIHAKVDGKNVIISEATIRRDLKFEDEGGFSKAFFSQQWKKSKTKGTQETQPNDPTNEALNEKNVPAQSNDPPLSRVKTLRRGEDRLKLKELMEIYITTAGIEETVSTAALITTADVTHDELTMAQALVKIKKSKPKGTTTTTTTTVTIPTLDSTRPKARGVIILVKDRFEKVQPVDDMDCYLLHTLKTMFEHHVVDINTVYYLLVEKMYLLTNHTLHQMFNNVKLQVDEEYEMAYELLRLVKK